MQKGFPLALLLDPTNFQKENRMFRIRRIFDDLLPLDREILTQVCAMFREHFPGAVEGEFGALPEKLRNPLRYRFRSIVLSAERQGKLRGAALMLHAPDERFCYLDYLAAMPGGTGGGIGGALYMRLREEARGLNAVGIFCESLPATPDLCHEGELLRQNASRLAFYERHGMRIVEGTDYATPISPNDHCPPLLLFDDLGKGRSLPRATAKRVVRAILERKYGDRCPAGYIDKVVRSFRDDPVRLSPPRFARPAPEPSSKLMAGNNVTRDMALVVNDGHVLHHVHERGYVESPARIESINKKLARSGLFQPMPIRHCPEKWISAVHDKGLLSYMKRCCQLLDKGKAVYPYVFPVRNAARPPKELAVRAGYYCIDTFTPLHRQAYDVARTATDAAYTAATALLQGYRAAYALVRPPGHHAERKVFGGFCYLNNSSVAANMLSRQGRVALLDVDYHHGNGSQDIFYERDDVLTVSIHGNPGMAYPYFSGFADEIGEGAGEGFNRNYPLPEHVDGEAYRKVLRKALERIRRFHPTFLVVPLGLDPAKGDPTGTWSLTSKDFEQNGRLIGGLGLPTLVVQEGGYRVPSLGTNALRFFQGLWHGQRLGAI